MRPLAELPMSVLREAAGLVFDVDDTLTTHGSLTPGAYAALCRLTARGIPAVAVTGRPLGWCDVMASMWPVEMAIGENGAGWVTLDGRALVESTFDDTETMRRHVAHLDEIQRAVADALPSVRVTSDHATRRYDLAFDIHERQRVDESTLAELIGVIESQGARAVVSSVHAHAAVGTWDKARGCARAIPEVLGTDARRWLFVGDSGNDEAAFEFFPVSVGVANVREHADRLRCHPSYITERERGEGFIELVDRLLESKRDD